MDTDIKENYYNVDKRGHHEYFTGDIISYETFDEVDMNEEKSYLEIIQDRFYYFYNYIKEYIQYYIE